MVHDDDVYPHVNLYFMIRLSFISMDIFPPLTICTGDFLIHILNSFHDVRVGVCWAMNAKVINYWAHILRETTNSDRCETKTDKILNEAQGIGTFVRMISAEFNNCLQHRPFSGGSGKGFCERILSRDLWPAHSPDLTT
jgi:hypothetical protein